MRELDNDSDEEEARKAREAFKLRAAAKKKENETHNRNEEEKSFKAKFAVIPPFKPKPKNLVPNKIDEQKLKAPEDM